MRGKKFREASVHPGWTPPRLAFVAIAAFIERSAAPPARSGGADRRRPNVFSLFWTAPPCQDGRETRPQFQVGSKRGFRRSFVDCSKANATRKSAASLRAGPKNERPIGSSPEKPAGTVM